MKGKRSLCRVAGMAAVVSVLIVSAGPEHAGAGEYQVRQCAGAEVQGFFGTYDLLGNDRVDVVSGCSNGGVGKIGIYQDRSGTGFPFGSGGQFLWSVPNGVGVKSTAITSRLNDVNGIKAELIGASSSLPYADLDQAQPHDGQSRTTRWSDPSRPKSLIIARLSCRLQNGCSNQPGGKKAFLQITDLEFEANDRVAPVVVPTGGLWELGTNWNWHRGDVGFDVAAIDHGAGIAKTFLLVNGLRLEVGQISCAGDKGAYATGFTPCPLGVSRSGTSNTAVAPFQEGLNLFQYCTEDYAADTSEANRACSSTRFAFIDNVVPAAPVGLETAGGSDWRSHDGFTVRWQNPEGQKAPIQEADFRLIRTADGSVAESGTIQVEGSTEIGPMDLGQPGEFRAEVKLRDAAGNIGSAASTILRFDDGRPGDVSPEQPGGWISADELPLEQPIERAEAGGPSGIEGYAVETSRTGPLSPCPSGRCQSGELSLSSGPDMRTISIASLAEGTHWISAVAASGAGLPSENPGSTVVRVDKTVPDVELEGVPSGWVNQPVTLVASAGDSGSGMTAKPEIDNGQPVTVIRAGDEAPYASPGDRASFTVASEGVTSVTYWARDLAGNSNDGALLPDGDFHPRPGAATVKIDRRPPVIELESVRDQDDPEVIRATARDSDSGLDRGMISYRAVSGGAWVDLETSLDGNQLSARIPSDRLPPGQYELTAEATDKAGNRGSSGIDSPMVLELPLKHETGLALRFRKSPSGKASKRISVGATIEVVGRLARADGTSVDASRVEVRQRFPAGSKRRSVTTSVKTDGTGRFLAKLAPGPSRRIQASYVGDRTHRPVSSRPLSVSARDRTSFRIRPKSLRNGGRVLMSGSVRGRGAIRPARGKLVAIQYFDPGRRKWRPVEVLRTSRNGRFRYRYRFKTITSAQHILFRAISLPEAGWPFRPSTSKRRSVIVYPKD